MLAHANTLKILVWFSLYETFEGRRKGSVPVFQVLPIPATKAIVTENDKCNF